MARRPSTTELVALTVTLVGPMALYVAHRQQRQPAETPLAMSVDEPTMAQRPVAPVIPVAEPSEHASYDRASSPAGDGGELEFALMSGGRLVLQTEVPAAWGKGEIRAKAARADWASEGWAEEYLYAEKDVDPDRLAPHLRELEGTAVDLYGPGGKVCTARLGALAVVAEVNGDAYGYYEDGDLDEEGKATTAGGRKIRRRVWRNAERWLMADLEAGEDCAGALFGRSSALPAPSLLTPRRQSVAQRVKADFLAGASDALESRYRTFRESEVEAEEAASWPAWPQFVRDTYERRVYVDGAGEARAVYQLVGDVESTCGWGFGDYYSRIDAKDPGTAGLSESSLMAPPSLMVDIDGDGRFELLTGGYDTALHDADGNYVMSAERPFEGCPC